MSKDRGHLVVGLGNPGPEYRRHRHNVGFLVVEELARRLSGRWQRHGPALVASVQWRGRPLYLAKPIAYMNVSGRAVAILLRDLDLCPADLIVVQDDIDMALGKVRSRKSGSAGGHNGIRSIIETLGTQEFRRVKIGVGHPGSKDQVVGHVLSPFTMEELLEVEVAVAEASDRVLVLAGEAARQRGTGP